jgi:hypothetical protein
VGVRQALFAPGMTRRGPLKFVRVNSDVQTVTGATFLRTRKAAVALVLAMGLGCASQVSYVAPPSEMRVYNEGGSAIRAINWKSCSAAEQAFAELPGTTIEAGRFVAVPLMDGCIDLLALRADGEVAGRQSGLRMMAGSEWRIR